MESSPQPSQTDAIHSRNAPQPQPFLLSADPIPVSFTMPSYPPCLKMMFLESHIAVHNLVLVQEGHGLAQLAHDAGLVGIYMGSAAAVRRSHRVGHIHYRHPSQCTVK
jgi:hypothetical protein